MTREQARKIIVDSEIFSGYKPDKFVNFFEALGMLKLDEPKSLEQKKYDVLAKLGIFMSKADQEHFDKALDAAGLRIVEK